MERAICLLAGAFLVACGGNADLDPGAVLGSATGSVVRIELRDPGRFEPDTAGAPARWVRAFEGDNAPARLGLALESRRAQCLVPGTVLKGQLPAPGSGTRLIFGYGVHSELVGAPARIRVRVTLKDADGVQQLEALPVESAGTWHQAELDVHNAAGGDVRCSFELLTDGSGAVWGAVEEPLLLQARSSPSRGDPPTVLLITSDTHRGDHLGSAGRGVDIRTPVIDALAARSVQFTDCFATTHVTLPSHTALFTGIHPRDTGVLDNKTVLSDEAHTLAEAFRGAGYRTFSATSLSLLANVNSGLGQGFDRQSAPVHRRTSKGVIDVALRWVDEAEGAPLFLWLHLFDAHGPYRPPEPFDRMYYPQDRDPFDPSLPPLDVERGQEPDWIEGVRDVEYVRGLYRGEISYLDEQLERLLSVPRIANGIVVFTADHGESLGEHGSWWKHHNVYPEAIHVPLILDWPGAPRGLRVDEPVSQVDLGRTLLDLAGIESSAFPGRNLLTSLDRGELLRRPRFTLAATGRLASITKARKHLILSLRGEHRTRLFDLRDDPGCERDLVETERTLAGELRAELVAWLHAREGDLSGRESRDPQLLEQLAELGYAEHLEEGEGGDLLFPLECDCETCGSFD